MTATAVAQLGQPAIDKAPEEPDDLVLWSVTTIIGVLEKPALLYWSAEQAAAAAINQQSTWRGMIEDCNDGCLHVSAADCPAVKWLRDARFRRPKNRLTNAELGTVFHDTAQTYALTGRRPTPDEIKALVMAKGGGKGGVFAGTQAESDIVGRMLDRFDGWLQRFTPSYQAAEVAVYSPTYGYAGQVDAFFTVDGVRFIGDYKTSREPFDSKGEHKTPYPEQVGLQLAAYRYAEGAAVWRPRRTEKWRRRYYLLSPLEQEMAQPVPEVDGGLVLQVTTESCEAFPVRCDQEVHRAFLNSQEVYRWVNETSKRAMAPPLEATT